MSPAHTDVSDSEEWPTEPLDESVPEQDAVRIGNWSDDELRYTAALINGFLHGQLDIPQGTTLRSFLSEQLRCSPMRVSKKLASGMIDNQPIPRRIGSAAFQPSPSVDLYQKARVLDELERLRKICFFP